MGVLRDVDGAHVLPPRTYTAEELADVPDEFDWRTDPRAAGCDSVKEIRDQANCGSCWAFGAFRRPFSCSRVDAAARRRRRRGEVASTPGVVGPQARSRP